MFVLEYKQLHIVKEPMRKNCTCQSYRWKQYAMCDDRQPLQDFIDKQPRPDEWRIEEYPNYGKRQQPLHHPQGRRITRRWCKPSRRHNAAGAHGST